MLMKTSVQLTKLISYDVVQSFSSPRLQMQDEVLETMATKRRAGHSTPGTGKPTSPRVHNTAIGDRQKNLPRTHLCFSSQFLHPVSKLFCHTSPASTAKFMTSTHPSPFRRRSLGIKST